MSTTEPNRNLGMTPQGEAVNADGTLKEAWEISWVHDPDDEDAIPAALFNTELTGAQKDTDEGCSSNRPTKRPRKRTKKTPTDVSVFLDMEAAVSGSSDESDDGTAEEFIDDSREHERDTVMGMKLLTAAEAESGFIESLRTKYVEKEPDTNDYSREDERDGDMGMRLLTAAEAESGFIESLRAKYVENEPDTNDYSSTEMELVCPTWEVPVTVGLETDTLYHILRRSEEGLHGNHDAPRSSFFKPNLPGRIFLEVLSQASAIHICTGIPGVYSSGTKRVAHDTAIDYLERERLTEKMERGHWVRLKRFPYKDDLALVTKVNTQQSTVDVVCMPRVYYSKDGGKRKRGTRPVQALFDPRQCGRRISELVVPGGYQFKDQLFDSEGYAILKDLPLGRYRIVNYASRTEYVIFADCNAVDPSVLHSAMKLLANRSLKRWDKIRVLEGQFQGRVGTVEEVQLYHVSVEFPDGVYKGLVELPLLSVTRSFEIGDRVLVNSGKSRGIHGFVVYTDDASELVTLHSTTLQGSEHVISVNDVQRMPHDESFVLPRPVPQKQPCPRDPNIQRLISSKVLIQTGSFKGYSGVIRSINGDGVADVELAVFSAQGIQMTQRHICQLYYIIDGDNRLYEIGNEISYDLTPTNSAIPARKTPTLPTRSRTPIPDTLDSSVITEPAWSPDEEGGERELIPSGVLPRIPEGHWIHVAARSLTKIRKLSVKVAESSDDFNDPEVNGRMGVMHGVNGNKVRVYIRPAESEQQGFFREIFYPFLSFVPPTRKNQTVVVVRAGSDQGSIQNVLNGPGEFTELGAVSGKYKFIKLKEIRTEYLATFL